MLIERALAPLFPAWALRRLQARMAFDIAARAYDAAKPARATKNWRAPGTSARAEDGPALAVLRNRSRDLVRNNPWARKIARQLPARIVGTGVVPRPVGMAGVTRKRALGVWQDWAAATNVESPTGFAGQQLLVARAVVQDGEALVLWTPASKAPGGWTTRVLEGDYLDETYCEAARDGSGRRIVNGIEFDAEGRRVAYHLFREHPGDALPLRGLARERVRVEARFVDHVFEELRPGQTRGVPWLAASMLGLRDVNDYMEAERWRKKIAAALAAFVTSPHGPAQSPLGQVRTEANAAGAQRAIETITPGTIKRLAPGEDVKFSAPPADAGLQDYLRWQLFAACAGVGVPYAEVTGDLSNANYSSMRVGRTDFWELLDVWQWLMVAPMLLDRAWARVQAAAGVPGIRAEWSFPKRSWIDPEKEVRAEKEAIRAGLLSQPDAIAARGDDWRQLLAEQKEFQDEADRLGLAFDTDGRRAAGGSGAPAGRAPGGSGDEDAGTGAEQQQ